MHTDIDDFNLRKAFEEMNAKLEQPHRLAEILCKTFETQKSVEVAIRKIIKTMIHEDAETRETLKSYQKEIHNEDWKYSITKFWKAVWGSLLFIAGLLTTAIIGRFLR
jgi:ferritin